MIFWSVKVTEKRKATSLRLHRLCYFAASAMGERKETLPCRLKMTHEGKITRSYF